MPNLDIGLKVGDIGVLICGYRHRPTTIARVATWHSGVPNANLGNRLRPATKSGPRWRAANPYRSPPSRQAAKRNPLAARANRVVFTYR